MVPLPNAVQAPGRGGATAVLATEYLDTQHKTVSTRLQNDAMRCSGAGSSSRKLAIGPRVQW